MLNRKDDGNAVIIANPATQEFEVGRTSLLIGLLKSVAANKDQVGPSFCKDSHLSTQHYAWAYTPVL